MLTVHLEHQNNLMEPVSCPGLFCPTIAADGVLTRIRIPSGQIFIAQLATLAKIMERSNCLQFLITNRSNIQLRSAQNLTAFDLNELQQIGLAAKNSAIDHLRNIMVSPMAGLEPGIFNVMPALREIEQYICNTPKLEALSAKFSIGLDGGELASVRDRNNDIWLVAEPAGYRLVLSLGDGEEWRTDWVSPKVVSLVSRVADRYLQYADQIDIGRCGNQDIKSAQHRRSRKPRLRDVIKFVGKDAFLGAGLVLENQASPNTINLTLTAIGRLTDNLNAELVHPQWDSNLVALEIICPLGQLKIDQINGLIRVLKQFGLGEVRLTPWQTLIIPNILRSSLDRLKVALRQIPLNPNANHPARGIIACSGKSGCQSAATHSQEHAQQLIVQLSELYDRPLARIQISPTIQISGCEKLCAQPKGSDITLIGHEINNVEMYGNLLPDEAINQVIAKIKFLNSE